MNKRRHQRIEVQDVVAKLSDEVDSFSGTVNDVSSAGMLLADLPKEVDDRGKKFSIIVSAKGKDYQMQVVPKWISKNYSEKQMGLAILEAPLEWTLFVMNCEPTGEDIWAATTHFPDC